MTILQINKYYYPRGGTEVIMLENQKLLESHGHAVVPFAMRHPENLETPYSHSFVSFVETEKVRFDWQGLRTAGRMLYSFEARKKLASLIRAARPEAAHVHSIFHQISPSVFGVLRKSGIRTIMSLHDWALLSPNYPLFHNGRICVRGLRSPWEIVGHKCLKGSAAASFWAAAVFWTHKKFRFYERGADRFIAPSEFVKNKFAENGFDAEKIEVLPHFIDAQKILPLLGAGDYVGYMGRLSEEKGVDVLLRAARAIPDLLFKIAGEGPDGARLKNLKEQWELNNVEFVGTLRGALRDRFYRNAILIAVPSVWYEPFGRVVLEAYAYGKPVVASRIGALPELVRDGETGMLFSEGDGAELTSVLRKLAGDIDLRRIMGQAGRETALANYGPVRYYEKLMRIYCE